MYYPLFICTITIVSFAAVIRFAAQPMRVVTPSTGGKAFGDDPSNGCQGDYTFTV